MEDPHADIEVFTANADPSKSNAPVRAAIVVLHGRGGSARDLLTLTPQLLDGLPDAHDVAVLAPQAHDYTWYPHGFMKPREQNEPWATSALAAVDRLLANLTVERTVLLGFSQGACLACEYAATRPRRYAGVVAFTGGLIGETLTPYTGDLAGTPVLLTTGDPDPHVPFNRVEVTAEVLRDLTADMQVERYPGKPHSISRDELRLAAELIGSVLHP
ncbi:MAG: alpha/beta fold hydrolase [Planctomycetota bacterium]